MGRYLEACDDGERSTPMYLAAGEATKKGVSDFGMSFMYSEDQAHNIMEKLFNPPSCTSFPDHQCTSSRF